MREHANASQKVSQIRSHHSHHSPHLVLAGSSLHSRRKCVRHASDMKRALRTLLIPAESSGSEINQKTALRVKRVLRNRCQKLTPLRVVRVKRGTPVRGPKNPRADPKFARTSISSHQLASSHHSHHSHRVLRSSVGDSRQNSQEVSRRLAGIKQEARDPMRVTTRIMCDTAFSNAC